MKKKVTNLFQNISPEEQSQIQSLHCMRSAFYSRNETIFHTGDTPDEIGIVESGSVNIESTDLWGNRCILSNIAPGHLFAETYVLCQEPMLVRAVAAEDSKITFLNLSLLLDSKYQHTAWCQKLQLNLLDILARKNLTLSNRIFCTSPKTIRERLLTYLSGISLKAGSSTFQIPFDRQQLADYLNLDRSALSKELGKMKRDGLIDFYKNTFQLKNLPE